MDCLNDHLLIMRVADEAFINAFLEAWAARRAFVACDDASLNDKIKDLKRLEAAADAAGRAAEAAMDTAIKACCSAR
jgi:hypothetical protein